MTDNYKDIYNQLKAILEGCDTIIDAMPFANAYIEDYPHMKDMILSYMQGKTYRDVVDIKTKLTMMYDTNTYSHRDDALSFVSKITGKTTDDIYKKTLERICNRKDYRRIQTKPKESENITKRCPHCSHAINMPKDTTYVICGYHNPTLGYDWNGCGKEWCFSCEKIMCKKWETHSLCLQINRYHNDECCLKHAKENGNVYPDDYCQCSRLKILNPLSDFA